MTFLTLRTADVLNSYAVLVMILQVLMELLINAVELIAITGAVAKVHLGRAVTVDAPAHAQGGKLFYFVHFLDRTMAGLTLYFAYADVLGMVEVYMVGKIVDLGPFYRRCGICIVLARLGIIADMLVQLGDLRRAIYLGTIFTVQLGAF